MRTVDPEHRERPVSALLRRLPRPAGHLLILAGALLMLYPLLWMIGSSLKPEAAIFSDVSPWPQHATFANYLQGWDGLGYSMTGFLVNSLVLCVLAVVGNLFSCSLAAFAFARLRFPLKKVLFAIMIGSIMLPLHATIVPQYILFKNLGWVGTILPLVVPKFLAVDAFFVFLLVQFIRTIPRELDDSAEMDGCGRLQLFVRILLPMMVPALATTAIFTFLWTWGDFFTQLVYLSGNPAHFTVPVALGAFVDSTSQSSWGELLAMSLVSLLPIFGFFVAFQKLLLEGISTTGLRG